MMLRTAIIDDEPLARERLELLLQDEPDVQIVARCANGDEALEALRSHPLDLLLLDIRMPSKSGLDLVAEVGWLHLPPVVFVTAFQEHAVRAFEFDAVDYLTKPVAPARLHTAIARVREKLAAKQALVTQAQLAAAVAALGRPARPAGPTRLLVRDGVRDILVNLNEVSWIEAADYYSSLHVDKRTYLLREPLTELSRRLDPTVFLRIHRSVIVNLNFVRELYREGRDEGTVVLTDGQRLRMSKAGRSALAQHLGRE